MATTHTVTRRSISLRDVGWERGSEPRRDFYGKSRLANAACTCQRQQPTGLQQFPDGFNLVLAPDEARELVAQTRLRCKRPFGPTCFSISWALWRAAD